ncbi:MAG TPA: hypothetical protein VMV69_25275 [Pirellulales bacterium]|nr:hypothetical protein [Pirellulales bacterium]
MKSTQAIRELVFQTVRQLGCESATVLGETILIRDGKYAGRRFEFVDGLEALWLIDADRIDFHAGSGELLRSLVVENENARQRSA